MSLTVFGAMRALDEGRHRAELYRGWGMGLGAGFVHAKSLEQLGVLGSERSEELRRYLMIGFAQSKSVMALAKARPKMFEPFEAAMLEAGEESGRLEVVLQLLARHYAREYKRMLKVREAMNYPLFFGLACCFLLTIPFLQRGGARAYVLAIAGSLIALLVIGGVGIGIVASIAANSPGNSLSRFARALALGAEAGMPRARLARLAADASGNAELRRHLAKRTDRQLGLMPLGAMWEGCRAVPPDLLSQMKVADATGDYANTLTRYSEALEEKTGPRKS